jgi:hypothetical protein
MNTQTYMKPRLLLFAALAALVLALFAPEARAQDTVTGAFEGVVRDKVSNAGIRGASVEIINDASGLVVPTTTDARGYFYSGVLDPGEYTIRVSSPAYQSVEISPHDLVIARPTPIIPRPIELKKLSAQSRPKKAPAAARRPMYTDALVVFMIPASAHSTKPTQPSQTIAPATQQTPAATQKAETVSASASVFRGSLLRSDARHDASFDKREVANLPLGGTTLTRTFDELALLPPGVAPPPETIGNGTGPGVGASVGSSGQFSANGLRSRGNNFTVDGSDNNDEDIGVRRQGFFALVPQPVESIQEYHVITLLAPAQFGRNIGAQVNAVSRSSGNEFHGTLYGLFNASQLNARNFFDTANGDAATPLRAGSRPVIVAPSLVFNAFTLNFDPIGGSPATTRNASGGTDSFTLGQGGFVLGGPIVPRRVFFFVSAEREVLNATKEESFAVPTVAERGAFGTGATGIVHNPFTGATTFAVPSTRGGDAIFSLFPFPNNPAGVYGENTFTEQLPASARGLILSAKLDANFREGARLHTLAGRYNFTDDWREIPSTGGALFSTLRPRVRTQNFSFFLNSRASASSSVSLFNQLRLSYGRTRLRFEEMCDRAFLIPSVGFPGEPCLLNAPRLENFTLPNFDMVNDVLVPNTGPVLYRRAGTVEDILGPVGQVIIAGFSPAGLDVFNFPQRRVNNTYQFADQLMLHTGRHNFTFGTDNRRTELNSRLPRNFRPLITFYGAPRLGGDTVSGLSITNDFVRPADLAAASAASGFFQTLTTGSDSAINLRFYQFDFFAQDEWRILPNLSLSYGLRYEQNTPPREVNRRIENTFNDPAIALVPGLGQFINGRTRVFDPDRNNFSPRFGLAYAPRLVGPQGSTVLRLGYGHYNDQILGAVVSQSRSVFPTFVTVNTAGGFGNPLFPAVPLSLLNPSNPGLGLVSSGTLNLLDSSVSLADHLNLINLLASPGGSLPGASGVEITLPSRRLSTPGAHHYSLSFEQRLGADTFVSVAYVGTQGHNLLRFTTPNLGSNAVSLVNSFDVDLNPTNADAFVPLFFGVATAPGTRVSGLSFTGGRPVPGVGGVQLFETTARSRYDAAQFELRGRFRDSLQYRLSYTISKALDDVSDVFDLAGAPALPQDSLTFADEYARANYDVTNLVSFNTVYDFPRFNARAARLLFGGLQLASTGHFRTGQPFTVNSIFDVNLDGNLTDRLNTTAGLFATGDRLQPLTLTTNDLASFLAPVGHEGQLARNTFRAGNVFELNLALAKFFGLSEGRAILLRTEVFNLTNRANFGVPVRFLEAPAFGRATSTVTPARRIQFYLRYSF